MILLQTFDNNCMLCVGQQSAYCVYLVACSIVLFSAVNVYVSYEQINDDNDEFSCLFCVVVAFIIAIKKPHRGDCHCLDWQLLTTRQCRDIKVHIRHC